MTMHRFPVTEAELSKLIRTCGYVHCSFGTGDLLWDDTKPIPEAVVKLGEMRGGNLSITAQKAQPQRSEQECGGIISGTDRTTGGWIGQP